MDKFTKEEMLDELRAIFLFEADHLRLAYSPKFAEAAIGFEPGPAREYRELAPGKVDLSRFDISSAFDAGYEYAFRPSLLNTLDQHSVQDLSEFMDGVPRTGDLLSGEMLHEFMTPEGKCQTVADAVRARWKLEWDDNKTHTFSTRELALLANMTEGAIRNALADKTESGLRAIPGAKPVSVEHEEAWRWLSGRRGFIPTPKRPTEDRFLMEHLRATQSAPGLGRLIASRLHATFHSPAAACEGLGWTPQQFDGWCRGTFRFDAEQAQRLATTLGLDVPTLVGKVLEVSLRRDLEGAGS